MHISHTGRIVLGLAVLSQLAGCAYLRTNRVNHAQEFADEMEAWKGRDISALMKDWGLPGKQQKLPDGTDAYEYVYSDGVRSVASAYSSYGSASGSSHSRDLACKITVFTDGKNVIQNLIWEGFCG